MKIRKDVNKSYAKINSLSWLKASLRQAWVLLLCGILLSCTSPQNPTTPVVTSTRSLQVQSCGTVTNPVSQDRASARRSGTCFWNAFQQCHPALLTYKDQISGIHALTIKSVGSNCEVTDSVRSAEKTPSTSIICSRVQAFRGGAGALILTDCTQNRNITIPIDPSIQ